MVAAMSALIVYGSLYPFDFYENWDPGVPFRALFATWRAPTGWGDAVANLLFYFPFGFFAVRSFRIAPLARVLLVVTGGIALSTSMELLQFYVVDRVSCMADVYANAAGTLAGAVAGYLASRALENRILARFAGCGFSLFLLACWLGFRLFPYVPVIDLHKYWRALRVLASLPYLSLADLYRNSVEWIAVAAILQRLPGVLSSGLFVSIFAAGILFARILIAGVLLSRAEVAGLVMGVLAWNLGLGRLPRRALVMVALIGGVLIILSIFSFSWNGKPGAFQWLMFDGLLEPVYSAVPSFFERMFLWGSLLWLLQCAGMSLKRSVLAAAPFALGICLVCVYAAGKTAGWTDGVILPIVALVMKVLDEKQVHHGSRTINGGTAAT